MPRFRPLSVLLALVASAFSGASAEDQAAARAADSEQWTIIHAGTLITSALRTPQEAQSVIIRNDRIVRVVNGYAGADEAGDTNVSIHDLKDKVVLPGLIDAHVHLGMGGDRDEGRDSESGDDVYRMVNVIDNAHKTLMAGFTTVRDVGAKGWSVMAFRDAVREGVLPGPRVFASGHIVKIGTLDADGPGACYDVASCKKAVRHQIDMGADWLKIYATCSGSKPCGREAAPPIFTEEELAAVMETAATREIPVTAHAHATAGINAALRAGVRGIEHGSYSDADSRTLWKRTGAFYTPTLAVRDNILKDYETASDDMKPVMEGFLDQHPKRIEAAYKSGVRIAAGSDAGVTPHGENARELYWYVKEAGLPDVAALQAATATNALMLGMEGELGVIAPGAYADIIAVGENPLENIEALASVEFVMANGVVVKNEAAGPVLKH